MGANVRGAEKVTRLEAWLASQGTAAASIDSSAASDPWASVDLWAYGNSNGDAALLARANHPFRV